MAAPASQFRSFYLHRFSLGSHAIIVDLRVEQFVKNLLLHLPEVLLGRWETGEGEGDQENQGQPRLDPYPHSDQALETEFSARFTNNVKPQKFAGSFYNLHLSERIPQPKKSSKQLDRFELLKDSCMQLTC